MPTRLQVDELEGRDVPSAYWVGDFSTDATDARNWYPYNQPPAGDLWFYGSGSLYDEVEGEWIDRPVGNSCYGLEGSFDEVFVGAGYANTITLADDLTVSRLWMESGAIDQAGHDITVTGSSSPGSAPADFYWTGGTLNSGSTPATISVVGDQPNNQVTTAIIEPTNYGTVTTGSTINFLAATVTFYPGTIDFVGGDGMNVVDSSASCQPPVLGPPQPAPSTIYNGLTRQITCQNSTFEVNNLAKGVGMSLYLDNSQLLINAGNTAEFQHSVSQPAQPVASSVAMTSGLIRIDKGATLKSENAVLMTGGKLATRHIATQTNDAKIQGNLLVYGGEVVVNDNSLNAPGVSGHVFGVLQVDGNITWTGGVYRPYLDAQSGANADLWKATGSITVSGGMGGARFGPVLTNLPGSGVPTPGLSWTVMEAGGSIQLAQAAPEPGFEAGGWEKYASGDGKKWLLRRT